MRHEYSKHSLLDDCTQGKHQQEGMHVAEINGQQRLFEMEWKDYGITEWRGAGDMALP